MGRIDRRAAAAWAALLLGAAARAQSLPEAGLAKPKPQQEEKQAPPVVQEEAPRLPLRLEEDEGGGFIDLGWLEMQPRVGIAMFSDDYRIDPSPAISVLFHAPMPWLSPSSNPGAEVFGIFAEVTVLPSVERDLDPPPDKVSGSCVFIGAGLDFTIVRNQSLFLVVQAGGQFGSYGGISDLEDGLAATAGLNFGFYVGDGLTLTLAEEAIFADSSNHILIGSLGLVIEF